MRRSIVLVCAMAVVSVGAQLPPGSVRAAGPSEPTIHYVHDELGRLTAVIDPSQGIARYTYDAVGNITAITRPDLSALSVLEVTPDRAVTGETIVVQGTGFDADPAANRVTIGGVPAAVSAASPLELSVVVPDGATDGPVTVATGAATAVADEVLRIGSLAPTIASVSPTVVAPGDAVTITGTHLGPQPLDVDLVLNHTRGEVLSTDGTTLRTSVPLDTGSGAVSVATIDGEAVGPDLFVTPFGVTPAEVTTAVRVDPGDEARLDLPVGSLAMVAMRGRAGARLVIEWAEQPPAVISLLDWRGRPLPMDGLAGSEPITSGVLTQDGSITLVVDNRFGAGPGVAAFRVTEVIDAEVVAEVGGDPVLVATEAAGQHATVRFTAQEGDRVIVSVAEAATSASAIVRDPYGMRVAEGWVNAGAISPIGSPFSATASGTFTIDLDPQGATVGGMAVSVAAAGSAVPVALPADGTPVATAVTAPGDQALLSFDALPDTRYALAATTGSTGCLHVAVTDAAGSVWGYTDACPGTDGFADAFLPFAPGPMTVTVSANPDVTGEVELRLFTVPADPSVPIADGERVTVTTEVPGQNGRVTFTGSAGDVVRFELSTRDIPAATVTVTSADGSAFLGAAGVVAGSAGLLETTPLPADGEYVVVLDPQGPATGSITVAATGAEGHRAPVTARASAMQPPDGRCAGVAAPLADPTLPTAWRPIDPERWVPDARALAGDWTTGRDPSPWMTLRPLAAEPGATAISGQVLRLHGLPLPDVLVSVGDRWTCTDAAGRFLLVDVPPGRQVVEVDARPAEDRTHRYGCYEMGVVVSPGRTTVVPWTVWLPLLDTEHTVRLGRQGTAFELTNPDVPGLRIQVPAGVELRGSDGERLTDVGITPVPIDRSPFPTPTLGSRFPMYFTVQPEGIEVVGGKARIIYPNQTGDVPGTTAGFWWYEADEGWESYGIGTVTADGRSVEPDEGIEELLPAAMRAGAATATTAAPVGQAAGGTAGDPVDLATGLMTHVVTDLVLEDTAPVVVRRSYRSQDPVIRPFGVGTSFDYQLYLAPVSNAEGVALALPDGALLPLVEVPGVVDPQWGKPVREIRGTPTIFEGARLIATDDPVVGIGEIGAWKLMLRDGTSLYFGDSYLIEIRDRDGATVSIRTSGASRVDQVMSPEGRWVRFHHELPDLPDVVTSAHDVAGRDVRYRYDATGHLVEVTGADGRTAGYAWSEDGQVLDIIDATGTVITATTYGPDGRVSAQTQADGGRYTFRYETSGGTTTAAEVTDPAGVVRRVTFDARGYLVTQTDALGTSDERTTTLERDPVTHVVVARVDPLGTRTEWTRDPVGRVLTETVAAGTELAATTTWTYTGTPGDVLTGVDPMGGTSTVERAPDGVPTVIVDAAGGRWTIESDLAGRAIAITDPTGRTERQVRWLGVPTGRVDAAGETWRWATDAAGRLVALREPGGATTHIDWDPAGRLVGAVDALGGTTAWTYDATGDLASLTDPAGATTVWTHDVLGRIATRTDPLGRTSTFRHDPRGLMTASEDATGAVATYEWDPLGRLTDVEVRDAEGAEPVSALRYTWDLDDRLLEAIDQGGASVRRTYDVLGRQVLETTPEGVVATAYDAIGRTTSVSVGDHVTRYAWDPTGRLTSVASDDGAVSLERDAAGRLLGRRGPGPVDVRTTWDGAGAIASIASLGSDGAAEELRYTRTPTGLPAAMSGSLAATVLPEAATDIAYDAAGQLLRWDDRTMTYDGAGRMTSDGTRSFTWDPLGRLTTIAAPDGTTELRSDPLGRLVEMASDGERLRWVHDGWNAVQGTTDDGAVTRALVGRGTDEWFALTDATGTSVPVVDELGSTLLTIDAATGAVRSRLAYTPYGAATALTGDPGGEPAFTGRPVGPGGLVDLRARWYDPGTGRFLSPDPLTADGPELSVRVAPTATLGTVAGAAAGLAPRGAAYREVLGLRLGLGGYAYLDSSPLAGRDPMGTLGMGAQLGIFGAGLVGVGIVLGAPVAIGVAAVVGVAALGYAIAPGVSGAIKSATSPSGPLGGLGGMSEDTADELACSGAEGVEGSGC